MKEIQIQNKTIGKNSPIFLIAEAGVNHNGKLKLAKKLIDLAAEANVDAIKFQSYITENVFIKKAPKAKYQIDFEKNEETFFEMVKKYEFNKEDFRIIQDHCKKKGIIFLSTPYDNTSVEWLEELNVPAYKIGSGDMNNFPLLKLICSKKKPIILSTGMATLEEVKETVEFLKVNNIHDVVILQCTTNYPSQYSEINLNVIETYTQEFPNYIIGFSDHSLGIIASIGAAAKGVKLIEKHFTLDKNMEGPDHKASLSPQELFEWVQKIRTLEKCLGSYSKKPSEVEEEISKIARKSIVSLKTLNVGDTIKKEDIGIKRPGIGIPPRFFTEIIGKKVKNIIQKDSVILWEDIE